MPCCIRTLVCSLWTICICASAGAAEPAQAALSAVATLDIPRYMGTWHEIARYPNRFQEKCVGETRADYTLMPDGNVQVINSCRLENGDRAVARGLARPVGGPGSPRLKVRFAPAWLSFIPAVWGDYWVIDLDAAYERAVVSEPTRQYLWILSRKPDVEAAVLHALETKLRQKGFDIAKLRKTGRESRPGDSGKEHGTADGRSGETR